jgi:biopolymer transport protein ExbD
MLTRTMTWAPFVSLFLILTLISTAANKTANGLSVRIAHEDKDCGDGRTTVIRVLENGKVRIYAYPRDEDLERGEFADRLRVIYSTRSERVLFLMADPNQSYQSVADVIDTSQKIVDFVAIVTSPVQPGYCLSIHFPPTFTDYNYVETPAKMKPVPLLPWW